MKMNKILTCLVAGTLAISTFCMPTAYAEQSYEDTLKIDFDLKTWEKEDAVNTATYIENYKSLGSGVNLYEVSQNASYIEFGAKSDIIRNQSCIAAEVYFEATDVNNKKIIDTVRIASQKDYKINGITCTYNKDAFNDFNNDGVQEVRIPTTITGEANKFNILPFDEGTLGYGGKVYTSAFTKVIVKLIYEIPIKNPNTDTNVTLATLNNGYTYFINGVRVDTLPVESTDVAFNISPCIAGFTTINVSDAIERPIPLKSSLFEPASIIPALKGRKENGKTYTLPTAVLNDILANYDDVKFTFNSYDGYVDTKTGKGYSIKQDNTDWYHPIFGQHLYNGLKDSDYNWFNDRTNFNLMTSGLVINSGMTMQLSDTEKFVWGDNSVSFYWSDIVEGANINKAVEYIDSMLLYTPSDWYWDTLTIEAYKYIADDVSTGEGVESNEENIIEEDIVTEPIIEEDVVTETVVNEVTSDNNPQTGNKSESIIILATILAAGASATVYKKYKK